jgi:hypothetical protein
MPISACIALSALVIVQVAIPAPLKLPDDPLVLPRRLAPLPPQVLSADGPDVQGSLFSPDRAAGAAAGAGGAAGLSLAGLARARGLAAALLRRSDGTTALLRVGQSVDGWRLASIGQDAVVITRGSEKQTLPVTASAVPAPGAATAQASDLDESEEDQ